MSVFSHIPHLMGNENQFYWEMEEVCSYIHSNLNALVARTRGHSPAVEVVADVVYQVLVVGVDGFGLEHAGGLLGLHLCVPLRH